MKIVLPYYVGELEMINQFLWSLLSLEKKSKEELAKIF